MEYFSVLAVVVAAEDGRRTECHVFAPASDHLGRVQYTFALSESTLDAYYSTPVCRLDS
jgi:hypothetical protein